MPKSMERQETTLTYSEVWARLLRLGVWVSIRELLDAGLLKSQPPSWCFTLAVPDDEFDDHVHAYDAAQRLGGAQGLAAETYSQRAESEADAQDG